MRAAVLCLLLELAAHVLQPAVSFNCPRECDCLPNADALEGEQQTITVDCSGRDLLEIPYPLPNGTSHLDVSNNIIQYIRTVDFSPGDTALKFLQLQNNDLIDIQSGAFRRLTSLETLNLNNNNRLGLTGDLRDGVLEGLQKLLFLSAFNTGLKRLPPEVMDSLRDVVHIDLRFNQLEEIFTGTFSNLQYLQWISLDSNFISDLQEGSFANLPRLLHLDLSDNQLRSVTERAFLRLSRIRSIDLSDNPIECACCAVYLHNYFSRKRLTSPVCQEPQQLRGANLLDLNTEDICVFPTAMVAPNETVVIASGTVLELNCVTTGTPPPEVTWSRDGMILEADESVVIIAGASLIITNTSVLDSGQYHCSASSTAGLVSSSVQVLVVSEEESLTEAVVKEDVVLECSSQVPAGVPVLWSFNDSTLAAVSPKYVVLRNGSLLIQDVWVEDMGDYTCQLGQLQLARTLVLTALPEIISINQGGCEEPSLVIVDSDKETPLTCEVTGIPTPTVRWFYTPPGGTLDQLDTQQFAGDRAGSTIGVIVLMEPDLLPTAGNEGNYTCVSSNDVGMTSQSINVVVRRIPQPNDPAFNTFFPFEGDTIIFECELTAAQLAGDAAVSFFDGGLPIEIEDGVDLTCDLNQTLVLSRVMNPDNVRIYSCRVDGESLDSGFFITVVLELPSIETECASPTVVVRAGDNVTLSCQARGHPAVMRVWSRGEEVLATGGRVTLSDDDARLSIAMVRGTDSGVYNCTVSNVIKGVSFTESYAQRLIVQSPPYFTYRPQGITVLSGGIAVIFCGGGGNPAPTVTWHRRLPDWVVEDVEADGRIEIADYFLLFTQVRLSDEGFYFCTLTSPLGTRTSRHTLLNVYMFPAVFAPQTQVVFEVGTTDGVLECSGSGDPQPDMQWLRLPDMSLIPSPGFPNYASNGSNLVILDVGLEDAGVYRCWVANAAGQVSQDITVTVIAPPSPSVEPGDVVANMGCQVVLSCLDGGNSPLNFQWSFNGLPLPLPLEMGPQATIRPSGELVLTALQLEDSGNYSCTVFGTFRNATSIGTLRVVDPLFPDAGPPRPPTITSPTPSHQLLSEGQVAQFVCMVGGVPQPQALWLKDWEFITDDDPRVEIFQSRVLVVSNMSVADSGVYTCMALNSQGNASQDFTLSVSVPSVITVPPLPQEIPVHSIFNLTCEADGNPRPVILWLLNDTLVTSDERRIVDPDTGTLEVFNTLVSEDSGFYTCLAWNEVGSDQHTVLVQITDIRTPLSLRVRPESQTLDTGLPLVLDCIVDGYPRPVITWTRDGVTLSVCPSGPQPRLCVDPHNYIYIPSAQQQDSGVYMCRVERDREVRTYSADITVLPERSAPVISLAPSAEFVVNGSSFSLDCVAEGSPPPDIQWLLNMEPVNLTEGVFVQLGNGSLLVLEAAEDTVGYFTCVADNGVGRSKVTVFVVLVEEGGAPGNETGGLVGPVMTSFPLGSLTMFPGQSRTLDCTASGEPPPTITWTRNGVAVVPLPTLSVASNGSLVLSAVTGTEEGNYSCIATNEGGAYQVHFELDIAGDTAGFSERRILTGSHVQLDCPGGAHVHAQVMWLHEDEVVHNSILTKVGGNGSLVISAAHMEHAGNYMCLSPGTRGWTRFTTQLQVTPREEPPYFTLEPSDVHVVKKGFLVLPCSAASSTGEHTHVHWRQADHNVSRTGPRHLVLQDNSLVMTNVRLQEAGEYSCVATNSYGHSISTATVTVSRLKVHQFVYREEGSTVILTCGLGTGEGVEWLRDDHTPLTPYNGEVWLHHVDHTHQGEYTCYHGKDRLNYFLVIQAAPTITTPPAIVMVSPGETTTLHCVATGRPRPKISWYRDGLLLETADHLSVLANGSLVLYEVEGGGVYTCRAHSTAGLDEIPNTIIVNKI